MITEFKISGFKRFNEETFTISPLTILTGLNGSGKTSFVQAFLLAWESSGAESQTVVRLNDPFDMTLGTAEDIRNWGTDGEIEFHMKSEEVQSSIWRFGVPTEDALYLNINVKPGMYPNAFGRLPRAFTYLSAERFGPKNTLYESPLPPDQLEVGVRGQYSAQMLSVFGNKIIEDKARLHPQSDMDNPTLLKYEVERWLGEIARPVEIDPIQYPGTTVNALRFRNPGGDWVRAPNMGFGISYALPIIIAGLTARSGGLIIVENPEAHLHPAGQSRMGVFLAWLAGRGVQVILETHSDHLLNGVRLGIGKYKYLTSEKATVHFFDSNKNDDVKVQTLKFTPIGGLLDWPTGFFDQYHLDVAALGKIRRGE